MYMCVGDCTTSLMSASDLVCAILRNKEPTERRGEERSSRTRAVIK